MNIEYKSIHNGLSFYKAIGFVATDEEKTLNGIRFTPMELNL